MAHGASAQASARAIALTEALMSKLNEPIVVVKYSDYT
jgi:hypothetical protein